MADVEEAHRLAQQAPALAQGIIPKIEKKWDCLIEVDNKILGEAAARAFITLDHLEIENPNPYKQAGHFGFWIRKLKPARVVNLKNFQNLFCQLRDEDLIKGNMEDIETEEPKPRFKFVNETFGILAAIGIIKNIEGTGPKLGADEFQDLVTNLRYHSFSPSALAAILIARMPR